MSVHVAEYIAAETDPCAYVAPDCPVHASDCVVIPWQTRRDHNSIVNGNNLIVLQCFGYINSMAVLIMGTVELEPLVTFSGDDPSLCLTLAAIIQRANEHMNHFVSSRVVIFLEFLLPEGYVRLQLLV